MARLTNKMNLAPVLDASKQWIERCLIGNGSVFSSSSLWTPDVVDEVKGAFVDNPDLGKDDFRTKLKGQLKTASPPAQQLMAEMLWALLLFPSNLHADTKRQYVMEIWALSGQGLDANHVLLADDVLNGIGSGGPGFNNHRWREMVFMIALTRDVKLRDEGARRPIFSDYDAFIDWMDSVPQDGSRQFRHMLRFFAFPDRVERMSSNNDRHDILAAFGVASKAETREWSDRQLDDALLKLRSRLEAESPTAVLDFYERPLNGRWSRAKGAETEKPSANDDEADGEPHYWIEKTIVDGRSDREGGAYALGTALWSPERDKGGGDIYRFMRDVSPGDIVLHLTDNNGFTGVSRAVGSVEKFNGVPHTDWGEGPSYLVRLSDFRRLEPALSRDVFFDSPYRKQLLDLIVQGGQHLFYNKNGELRQGAYLTPAPKELVSILDSAYQDVAGRRLLGEGADGTANSRAFADSELDSLGAGLATTLEGLLREAGFVCEDHVPRSLLVSLIAKPFAILTGNSGTGKTLLGRFLAQWLAGLSGSDTWALIPVGADWTDSRPIVGFTNLLRERGVGDGGGLVYQSTPVLDLMLRARSNPTVPHFLILDEMNLSHVERYFSDFLSGMESGRAIPLHTESGPVFTTRGQRVDREVPIPNNFFIVGTVNVDETTYMFSPKVLDRANVIEFRVTREQLDAAMEAGPRRFDVVPTSPLGAAEAFLRLSLHARGILDAGASSVLPNRVEIEAVLRDAFTLLGARGYEFAHRTVQEVIRYLSVDVALDRSNGEWSWTRTVDLQILQKLLPKLHGTRRRLEPLLVALVSYCGGEDINKSGRFLEDNANLGAYKYDPTKGNDQVRFAHSYHKLGRMLDTVRREQFVSYIQ